MIPVSLLLYSNLRGRRTTGCLAKPACFPALPSGNSFQRTGTRSVVRRIRARNRDDGSGLPQEKGIGGDPLAREGSVYLRRFSRRLSRQVSRHSQRFVLQKLFRSQQLRRSATI